MSNILISLCNQYIQICQQGNGCRVVSSCYTPWGQSKRKISLPIYIFPSVSADIHLFLHFLCTYSVCKNPDSNSVYWIQQYRCRNLNGCKKWRALMKNGMCVCTVWLFLLAPADLILIWLKIISGALLGNWEETPGLISRSKVNLEKRICIKVKIRIKFRFSPRLVLKESFTFCRNTFTFWWRV